MLDTSASVVAISRRGTAAPSGCAMDLSTSLRFDHEDGRGPAISQNQKRRMEKYILPHYGLVALLGGTGDVLPHGSEAAMKHLYHSGYIKKIQGKGIRPRLPWEGNRITRENHCAWILVHADKQRFDAVQQVGVLVNRLVHRLDSQVPAHDFLPQHAQLQFSEAVARQR